MGHGEVRTLFVDGSDSGQVRLATSYFARLRGLLGTRPGALPLLLSPANSVHGVGMTYTLDVASLDNAGRVVHLSRLHPFGLTRPRRGVTRVLEATSGSFTALGITQGVIVAWSVEPVSANRPRRNVVVDLLRRDGGSHKSRPRSMTDAHRERSVSFFVGTALLIAGAVCLAVGAIAWGLPTPEPVRVTAAVPAVLPNSSVFDSGVTLFANVPDHRNPPVPQAFGCQTSIAGDSPTEALARPIPEFVGSRVVDGAALTGVIDLGHPAQGAQVRCDGPAAAVSPSLWVLPSKDGPSDQPLAIVVAALLLIGLGALVHPRTRSM